MWHNIVCIVFVHAHLLISGDWEQSWSEEDNQATKTHSNNPVTASLFVWAYCMYGWRHKCWDNLLTAPPSENWRRPQGHPLITWLNSTPSSEIWELKTSHWMKQSTWLRTILCGGCWLCMALHTPRGACQKRRHLRTSYLLLLFCSTFYA